MSAKVFLAAIAQPDAQLLRNFIFLGFGKLVIKFEGAIAFSSASGIAMSVPKSLRGSNPPTGFFH